MPVFFSKIASTKKSNTQFAAMSDSQIEFFDLKGSSYFAVYQSNADGWREMVINLSKSEVTEGVGCYYVKSGIKLTKFIFVSEYDLKVEKYLWGWLMINSYSGTLSESGRLLVETNLKSFCAGGNAA